jgi:hypothetical protein
MATTEQARTPRAELQAWYLGGLLPKLTRAANAGVVDLGAVDALDATMRGFLALSRTPEKAA